VLAQKEKRGAVLQDLGKESLEPGLRDALLHETDGKLAP
jgi:hypothetical protein